MRDVALRRFVPRVRGTRACNAHVGVTALSAVVSTGRRGIVRVSGNARHHERWRAMRSSPHRMAHAAFAASRKFRSRPCFSRCHTGDMEIALHSHAHRAPMQTFKTAE
ncbi:hypothetical protein G3N96_05685 [Burkholderia sp. Se-20373]|uniref:hypothetical protein n=1 Tax=Burkholderia sp. Se-20373 TaxID=2703898 RepID=UPI00197EE6B8|nr:hypothetical protein [Burkholderia sp. Se-20373]MBN3744928.1 hypothetical protein [Burkholderia sp. Se-20373]